VRRLVAVFAVLVAAVAAMVLPASPAAAIGYLQGMYWEYETPDTIDLAMWLDGAEVTGTVKDEDGDRSPVLTVSDTEVDGRCVRGKIWSLAGPLLGEAEVCDGEAPVTFHAESARDGLQIVVMRSGPPDRGAKVAGMISTVIPSSVDDPHLRWNRNGVSWNYYEDRKFGFEVMRNAKRIWGYGEDLKAGERDVHGLASIIAGDGCVTGDVLADNVGGTATVCSPDSYYPIMLAVPVIDSFKARVCVQSDKNPGSDGCLIGSVPQRTSLGLAP
jgi:hypothetical protein